MSAAVCREEAVGAIEAARLPGWLAVAVDVAVMVDVLGCGC